MHLIISSTGLSILLLLNAIHGLPTTQPPAPSTSSPPSPCTNMIDQATYQNYTSLYTCTLKADYAILGLFYDSCTPLNTTSTPSTSSSPSSNITNINTLFCCDPTYASPASFDSLCIWGNGTNMAEWRAQGHPAGQLPTTSPEEMRDAKCFVGPIIDPSAMCVQVDLNEGMPYLEDVYGVEGR